MPGQITARFLVFLALFYVYGHLLSLLVTLKCLMLPGTDFLTFFINSRILARSRKILKKNSRFSDFSSRSFSF